ncbi:unnamed protein product [Peniophora sp. CBMAI 1063]|nr:unnamed protein product [Peniophora sp. CBMAI 1063]
MNRLLLCSRTRALHLSTLGCARDDAIIQHLSAARSLELYANYIPWNHYLNRQYHFPELEFLWLQRPDHSSSIANEALRVRTPRLRTLRMDMDVVLDDSSLRVLILGFQAMTQERLLYFGTLLQQSPNLTILHVDDCVRCSNLDWSKALLPLSNGPLRELYLLPTVGHTSLQHAPDVCLPYVEKVVLRCSVAIIAPRVQDADIFNAHWSDLFRMLRGLTNAFLLAISGQATGRRYQDARAHKLLFPNLRFLKYEGDVNEKLFTVMDAITAPFAALSLRASVATIQALDTCDHEANVRGTTLAKDIDNLNQLRTMLEERLRSEDVTLDIHSFAEVNSDIHHIRFALFDTDTASRVSTTWNIQSAGIIIDTALHINFCEFTARYGLLVSASHILTAVSLEAVTVIHMPISLSGPREHWRGTIINGAWTRTRYTPTFTDWTFLNALNLPEMEDIELLYQNMERMRNVRELDMTMIRETPTCNYAMLDLLSTDEDSVLLPLLGRLTVRGMFGHPSTQIGAGNWWGQLMKIAAYRPGLEVEFRGNICNCRHNLRTSASLNRLRRMIQNVSVVADTCELCT